MDFFNSISFLLKVNHLSFPHQPFPYYDSLSLPFQNHLSPTFFINTAAVPVVPAMMPLAVVLTPATPALCNAANILPEATVDP